MKTAKLILGLLVVFGTYAHGIRKTCDHFSQEDEAVLARIDSFLMNRNALPNDKPEQIAQECVQYLLNEDALLSSSRQLAIDTADLALRVSGHSGSTLQLSRINIQDLKNIRKSAGGNCISYHAILPNGDMLSCNFFIAGPCKGQIDCTRMVMTRNGQTVMLPVSESLYFELERLYNAQNKHVKT